MRLWYKLAGATVILCFVSAPLLAQMDLSAFYAFLRLDPGTRGAALGGAAVALQGNVEDGFYNPAALSTLDHPQATFTFEKQLLDINAGFASVAVPARWFARLSGMVGLAATYVDYGVFERNDEFGNPAGTFRAAHLLVQAQYSNRMDTLLYYGVTLKFIASTLEQYSATAIAVDGGLLYILPQHRTAIGFAIRNVGVPIATTAPLEVAIPVDVRVGLAHKPRGLPLLLNVAFVNLADSYRRVADLFDRIAIGGEWYLGRYLQLRIGYNQFRRLNMRTVQRSGWSGFSAGLGLQIKQYRFDYAAVVWGIQSFIHRLSVRIQW